MRKHSVSLMEQIAGLCERLLGEDDTDEYLMYMNMVRGGLHNRESGDKYDK